MRRRDFMTLLGGGAAAAWPLAVHAQQPSMKRVAVVIPDSQGDREWQVRLAAFVEALARLGWSDGRNVRLDVRWVGADTTRYNTVAMELTAGLGFDVIVAAANPLVAQFQLLTKTIPIVFIAVSDPVGGGFVNNVARPGGNMTGFENFQPEMGGKWLGLLKEAVPGIKRIGILLHPGTSAHTAFRQVIETAAPTFAVTTTAIGVQNAVDIERGFAAFVEQPDGGLIVLPHPILTQNRDLIIVLTARHRLPAIYPFRYFAIIGGLISYGIDPLEQWRGAAGYVDRILKGEKAGDLPVQALNKYELVINLKTAKAIGLNLPAPMLDRTDKVIE
jgi:putative ABC transport system substrate-binding protein